MSNRIPRRRRHVLGALATAGVVALITGCSAVETQDPGSGAVIADNFGTPVDPASAQQGGTLVVGLSSEPDTLDPTLSGSLYSRFIFASMCEKLYDTDENANVVPQLASELPEISDDGLSYTIALRTDAVFADGTPMDAEAVAASLRRNIELETSRRKAELGPLQSVTVVDASTVRLDYATPFAPLPTILADRAGMVLSPTALAAAGEQFGADPVCVAPFKFASWVPQTSITLEKDPNYYDADEVFLDGIEYRLIVDSSVRAANLRSGDIHVADAISTQDATALASDDEIDLLQSAGLGWRGLVINVGNADGLGAETAAPDTVLAQERLVREALALSIDREALVAAAFGGWYQATCSPIRSGSTFDSEATTGCAGYDPEKALELLEEAGVETPVPVKLLGSTNPDTQRYLQALQSQVDKDAFTITLDPLEESSLVANINSGDFEVFLQEWAGRADPDGNMRQFLSFGGSQNYSGYSSDSLTTALNDATASNDVDERLGLYEQAMDEVFEESPIIYLFRPRVLTGVSEEVGGVIVYPDALPRLAFAAFTQ